MTTRACFAILFFALLSGCSLAPPLDSTETYTASIIDTQCEPIEPTGVPPTSAGMKWEKNVAVRPQRIVCWETVKHPQTPQAQQRLVSRCGADNTWNGSACIMWRSWDGTCWVLSTLTLAQAKITGTATPLGVYAGPSVYRHEVEGHCQGFDHPSTPSVRLLPQ